MKRRIRWIPVWIMLVVLAVSSCSGAVSNTEEPAATTQTVSASEVSATEAEETLSGIDNPMGSPPGDAPPGGGGSAGVDTGSGAYTLSDGEEVDGGTYTSSNDDENAIRAEGDISAVLNDVVVEKSDGSASSSDASSFYGLNAAVLALDGATLVINGGVITATAEGSNGVFAYDGATIYITESEINVSGGNGGGIEVAGGGNLYAANLTVNSVVKAAIRSDRGGGILVVDGGTYITSGSAGAPAIYSTAEITVSNATLISNDSEAVVVEGLNSVTIIDSDVSGNMTGTYGADSGENIQNVMLYQSMSGDAEAGTSSFTMSGGSLVSNNGDMFYVTNTDSIITLSGVDLTLADGTYLLLVAGNDGSRGWGAAGANGGTCEFNLSGQSAAGDIMVDPISELSISLVNGSTWVGAANTDGTEASSFSVTLDDTSTWELTGDSHITNFDGNMDQVLLNGHTLYVNGTAVEG